MVLTWIAQPRRWMQPVIAATFAAALLAAGCARSAPPDTGTLPLQSAGDIPLPGSSSRFDYEGIDPGKGLLFIAHLGDSEVLEVDLHTRQVLRTIPNLSQVHGVLVVPELGRVYATATGEDRLVILDENTGAVLAQGPTGRYPDGIAYDPGRRAVWTTNETGGTETVLDAATGAVRETVDLGAGVGNVVYDPVADRMLVAVQGRNELAVIDAASSTVTRRVALPGCEHPHGVALDRDRRLAFVACDHNATVVTVDQTTWQILGTDRVGDDPDVLAFDPGAHRLYVAAESGWVTVLDLHDHDLVAVGSDHLADGAHVVAVDPATHHSYYPVPAGADGHPALLELEPTR